MTPSISLDDARKIEGEYYGALAQNKQVRKKVVDEQYATIDSTFGRVVRNGLFALVCAAGAAYGFHKNTTAGNIGGGVALVGVAVSSARIGRAFAEKKAAYGTIASAEQLRDAKNAEALLKYKVDYASAHGFNTDITPIHAYFD